MTVYTRKGDIKPLLIQCIKIYDTDGVLAFSNCFHEKILNHKVKFPLLEYCARSIAEILQHQDQITFCDMICQRKTEGGNVILGILLQLRLLTDFLLAIDKTVEYIADADEWYVCDIIGERVFGVGLLQYFDVTFEEYNRLKKHRSSWVVRSLGAGAHYAIKKGLDSKSTEKLFQLLLVMSGTNDRQIRQGVGWAAKTTARFHPEIIEKHQVKINDTNIPNWFRSKILIGLNRHRHHAQRN